MKKFPVLLLFLLLGFSVALYPNHLYSRNRKAGENFNNEVHHSISYSTNQFGFSFYKELSPTQNVLLSPISISMLMGLLYSGARNKTAEEIRKVLQFPLSVHEGFKEILDSIKPPEGLKTNHSQYSFEIASAMLVDNDFNILPSYKGESRIYYEAAVEAISFSLHPEAAVKSVNGWVEWRTQKKISKILDEPLDPLTLIFLMNAVYFKGTWKTKFDQRFTMPDTFYNKGLIPKTVPMMRQKAKFRYDYDTTIQAHALELPFSGNAIKMLLLLPERRDGLQEMEALVTSDLLYEIAESLQEVSVQVTIPRFNLVEDYDLIPILKKMGIYSVFNPILSNLTGISPKTGLYVTKAVHKCAIEVNEEGSEAAAVTGVSAGVRTGYPLIPLFNADHPFMFYIRDNRLNLTLFLGRVTQL